MDVIASFLSAMDTQSFTCSVCSADSGGKKKQQIFNTIDVLRSHITTTHCSWIPFECVLCPSMFMPTETVLKQHYTKLHPCDVPKAIYTFVEDKKKSVKRILAESLKIQTAVAISTVPIPASVHEQQNPVSQAVEEVLRNQECNRQSKALPPPIPIVTPVAANPIERFESCTETETITSKPIIQTESVCVMKSTKTAEDILDDGEESKTDSQPTLTTNEEPNPLKRKQSGTHNHSFEVKMPPTKQQTQEFKQEFTEMKTPSVKNHRGVFSCGICNDKKVSHKSKHIWQYHMSRKRAECNSCAFESHYIESASEHQFLSGHEWTDNKERLFPEYQQACINAFGNAYQMHNNAKASNQSQCKLCGEWTENKNAHIRQSHMPLVFRCQMEKCRFRLSEWNESEAKHHLATGHAGVVKLKTKWNLVPDTQGRFATRLKKAFD